MVVMEKNIGKNSLNQKCRGYFEGRELKIGFAFLMLVATVLVAMPHLWILYFQHVNNLPLTYSPAVLNDHWVRFDDIVKVFPAWQFAKELSIFGKLGVAAYPDEIYPNTLQEILPNIVYGFAVYVTDNPATPFYVLSFFSALAGVCGAALVLKWTNARLFAFCSAFIMVFAYHYFFLEMFADHLLNHPFIHFLNVENKVTNDPYEYNSFYRIHTLGATYFAFLLFFYYLWKSMGDVRSGVKIVLLLGFLFGAQFYLYVFYSLAASGIMAVAIVVCIVRGIRTKKYEDWLVVKRLFFAGLLGTLIAIPSVLSTLSLVFTGAAADWVARIQGQPSETWFYATPPLFVLLGLCVLFLPGWRLKTMSAGLIITVLIVENLYPLVGFNIQAGHIYHRTAMPLMVLFIMILMWRAFSLVSVKVDYLRLAGGFVLVVATAFYGLQAVRDSYYYAKSNYMTQGITGDEEKTLSWLKDNVGENSEVGIIFPKMNMMGSVYAKTTVYLPFSGFQYQSTTNDYILDRFSRMLWLAGADERAVALFSETGAPYERYPYFYFQRLFKPLGKVPASVLRDSVLQRFANFEAKAEDNQKWPDYMVIGGHGDAMRYLAELPTRSLELVKDFGAYKVYCVKEAEACKTIS